MLNKKDIEELKIIIEEWKTIIQTQMHFNEMIMRMRTTSISIFLAIFGAAAYSMQYKIYLKFSNFEFHASVLIMVVGLAMLISVFFIDFFYYNKMLRGAVEKSYEIDDAFKNTKIQGTTLFGMSTLIKDSIGKEGTSKKWIILFYLIPIIIGTTFMLLVLCGFKPITATHILNDSYNSTINGTG